MDVNKEIAALADALYGSGKAPAAFSAAVAAIASLAFAQGRNVAYEHVNSVLEAKLQTGNGAHTLN